MLIYRVCMVEEKKDVNNYRRVDWLEWCILIDVNEDITWVTTKVPMSALVSGELAFPNLN